ncbi:MAG: PEP-CTERM sorting domain-containing protein [Planctomycetaceae bacterium]
MDTVTINGGQLTAAAVPEPATGIAMLVGSCMVLLSKCRRRVQSQSTPQTLQL